MLLFLGGSCVGRCWQSPIETRNVCKRKCVVVVAGQRRHAVVAKVESKKAAGTFREEFGSRLPEWLTNRLEELGFETPTEVQRQALEYLLVDNPPDLIAQAQTGSGKTLAYLIPVFALINPSRSFLQAVVVVPTQELGIQVYRIARRLASGWTQEGSQKKLVVLPMLDQADFTRQKLQLKQAAPRIVVGTLARLTELNRTARLNLDTVSVLVVDEFDACFRDDDTTAMIRATLQQRAAGAGGGEDHRQRQVPRLTILASATVPQHRYFVKQCVREGWTKPNVKHAWIDSEERVPLTLSHYYAVCDPSKKLVALKQILRAIQPTCAMVFINTNRNANTIATSLQRALKADPSTIVAIEQSSSLPERKKAMAAFRSGAATILIASDVAARGLDIPDVTHVFNIDIPDSADTYLHRAGRTARLGRDGAVVTISGPGELFVLERISNSLGIDLEQITDKTLKNQNRNRM